MNCASCGNAPAALKRSLSRLPYCKECFIKEFENEVHATIVTNGLISEGDRVCIGVSGGKDSAVLAHVLSKINKEHMHAWNLFLLAIDEGITGYRDDSLDIVRKMDTKYVVPLLVLDFKERFGFTMDQVVALVGRRTSCTICGAFRRQLLEIGARVFNANVLCTGHTADDNAETVLLNFCRGDLRRLASPVYGDRIHSQSSKPTGNIRRIKPLMRAFEKEVVLYARFLGLEYFSTECTHAPEAFRGYMRNFIKRLESVDPRIIANIQSARFFRPAELRGNGDQTDGVDTNVNQDPDKCSKCNFVGSGNPCGPCKIVAELNKKRQQQSSQSHTKYPLKLAYQN
ncbi:bifunctional Uncharacterized protein family UPF0021 [Babesia duncani]|uniref:Bifunctional Uncharacterized protein family UPF0021 n=1 Tax=Babesia duncani TaxID=323732 RepID=A0AAD9UQG1_9APIC|nr:bifunctional Uncharacterized protein family UPF0021 [Babesia duncani]KAK2197904.1 bifunctional Uncharacterized protein family UPF0021 [Babesia duncani]